MNITSPSILSIYLISSVVSFVSLAPSRDVVNEMLSRAYLHPLLAEEINILVLVDLLQAKAFSHRRVVTISEIFFQHWIFDLRPLPFGIPSQRNITKARDV